MIVSINILTILTMLTTVKEKNNKNNNEQEKNKKIILNKFFHNFQIFDWIVKTRNLNIQHEKVVNILVLYNANYWSVTEAQIIGALRKLLERYQFTL